MGTNGSSVSRTAHPLRCSRPANAGGGGADEPKGKRPRASALPWSRCGGSGCFTAGVAAAVAAEPIPRTPLPRLDRGAASNRQPPSGYRARVSPFVSFSPFPVPSLGWGRGVTDCFPSGWSPCLSSDASGVSELGLPPRTFPSVSHVPGSCSLP